MYDYAIGDIQGCYEPLRRLLDYIQFDASVDRLWLVGDLVNRGPHSLEVLQFIKSLPITPKIVLGNHDFHLLHQIFIPSKPRKDDTLAPILKSSYKEEWGHWLRQQALIHYDKQLNVLLCHAGIAPVWDLMQALQYSQELEVVLQSELLMDFLQNLYGNKPNFWDPHLTGVARWRAITNYLTRMRFCDDQGKLLFDIKSSAFPPPKGCIPWYAVPHRKAISADIVFGHWAALQGQCPYPHIFALDTGCIWGGRLTALRLQDKKLFSVPGLNKV